MLAGKGSLRRFAPLPAALRPAGSTFATGGSGGKRVREEREHVYTKRLTIPAELERKVGQLAMENDFLKKALLHFKAHHPPAVISGAAACTKKSAKARKRGKP